MMKAISTIVFFAILMLYRPVFAEFDGWRVLPIRSQEEFTQGATGGESEQHPQGIARCYNHPEVIYLVHDVGQVWKSVDAGNTWRHTLDKGMNVIAGQSIEVDPVNPDIVFAIIDATFDWYVENKEGLYRSIDGGDNWTLVLPAYEEVRRNHHHTIAYDPATIDANGARRWYAAFQKNGLYRSEDYGVTWSQELGVGALAGETVYDVRPHPTDGKTVYIGTSSGLLSYDRQTGSISACGNLPPAIAVTAVEVNPKNPNEIYASLYMQGLYKSTAGVSGFALLRSDNVSRVFMNPGFPNVLYLVLYDKTSLYSRDGGLTWGQIDNVPFPGLNRPGGSWKERFSGNLSGVVPNPQNELEAVAYSKASLWKTTDAGAHFNETSTLFTGYAWGRAGNGLQFDLFNAGRWFAFHCDVGMAVTRTKGDYFERRAGTNLYGMYTGAVQPIQDSQIIITAPEASRGDYFRTLLYRSTDEGRTWAACLNQTQNPGMQNLFIGFDPTDPNRVYAGNQASSDAGATWQEITGLAPYDGSYNAEVIGICQSDPSVLYAIQGNPRRTILRSNDKGATWQVYAQASWSMNRMDSYPTVAVDPFDCNKVYTLDSRGDVAVFNGTTWKSLGVLDRAGSSMSNFVRGIAVDPVHPGIIYAAMQRAGIDPIWRSVDGGQNWENISYNIPQLGWSSLKVNPHTGEVFAGSCIGTWILPPPQGFNYPSKELVYDRNGISMPSCSDGIKNGDEKGVDCGGSCLNSCSLILYGDISGEGDVTAYDAALTARIAVGLDALGDKLTVADVSGDKQVTAYDAALIAQKAVGLITKFPVES
jgi:photosystem II stability/assembly factor-like uncharacterized protein